MSGYTMLENLDVIEDNIPEHFQERVKTKINNFTNSMPITSDNNMNDSFSQGPSNDPLFGNVPPPATARINAPYYIDDKGNEIYENGKAPVRVSNDGQGWSYKQNGGVPQQENQRSYEPSPYLDEREKTYQQSRMVGYAPSQEHSEQPQQPPQPQQNTCLEIDKHIKNCSICSKLHACDKKPYIIIIFILVIITILLMKKALNL